jgi:citrate lyase subunit gamma (acyl carrier protein)
MIIKRIAHAGTLESSDISVTVSPDGSGIQLELVSSVEKQFGDAIRAVILETAAELGADNVNIKAVDHGALDCTIRARIETALRRAAEEEGKNESTWSSFRQHPNMIMTRVLGADR